MIANEHLKENLTLTDKVNACNPFEKYSFIQKLELYCNLYNSLSRRSKNVLMKNGIDRIDKLLGHNFSSILALKNAGRKTAEEIILKFEKLCHVPEKYLENSANGKYVFDKAFFNFLENLSERAKNVVFNYDLNKIEVLANKNF
jgi:DNA-directed RNA polymerase alpha subunit